jgi:two-component system, OmpR family, sensor histidine kinase VicK
MHQTIENTLSLNIIENNLSNSLSNISNLNLIETLEPIFNRFSVIAILKNINFTIQSEDSIPNIEIDKEHLERVLYNVIDNALKFTEEFGQVDIKVTQVNDYAIQFLVKDTGCGIPKKEHATIFNKFTQSHAMERGGGVVGLGLYIVKEIVNKYHGQCLLKSTVGKGTSIYLKLPIRQPKSIDSKFKIAA